MSITNELPDAMKARIIKQYGLTVDEATILVADPRNVSYFEVVLKHGKGGRSAKTLLLFILNYKTIVATSISIDRMANVIDLVETAYISSKVANDIIDEMLKGDVRDAKEIVDSLGVSQISEDSIDTICLQVLNENKDKVMEYRSGKTRLFHETNPRLSRYSKGELTKTY
ncbi:hypothetical protein DFA_09190 [Cavenderia fasciculata]|uniref:Asn/Gln amidotransferase domain-containing protein n=1 Tax=Cavenderia fasciculata TaxID=261658 RepID=F4Q6Y1_CACFS|nr:uncharacterized protein DFA_09190 [Cavenderia fasciculata]EGG16163.1 hypothetical protein DFA_09190 [Cavenderia fasciculata]|eukprot:XP_004352616.1 hypothetical protein DFA_09190 [Cavenderia fasciculata]